MDPLPLRQDQWHPNGVSGETVAINSAYQERSSTPPVLKSTKNRPMPCWSPSPRIQGTLKDPEFQHNGTYCLLTGCVKECHKMEIATLQYSGQGSAELAVLVTLQRRVYKQKIVCLVLLRIRRKGVHNYPP